MAELERIERNDEGRAREWIARAVHAAPDPAWTADGYVSDRWLPVSPVSGQLDVFEWRAPLAGIASAAAVINPEPSAPAPVAAGPRSDSARIAKDKDAAAIADEKAVPPAVAAEPAAVPPSRRRGRLAPPKPEAVIPLVHAPDDPGPDAIEGSELPQEPQNGGWRKIFE
jgi:HemY protein